MVNFGSIRTLPSRFEALMKLCSVQAMHQNFISQRLRVELILGPKVALSNQAVMFYGMLMVGRFAAAQWSLAGLRLDRVDQQKRREREW